MVNSSLRKVFKEIKSEYFIGIIILTVTWSWYDYIKDKHELKTHRKHIREQLTGIGTNYLRWVILWVILYESYISGIKPAPECFMESRIERKLGKIGFTGFTNSSGVNEVLRLLGHSSGFYPITATGKQETCIGLYSWIYKLLCWKIKEKTNCLFIQPCQKEYSLVELLKLLFYSGIQKKLSEENI